MSDARLGHQIISADEARGKQRRPSVPGNDGMTPQLPALHVDDVRAATEGILAALR